MEKSWIDRLKQSAEKKPIVILRFKADEWERLLESRRGVNEFTIARSHEILEGVKSWTLCLIIGKSDGDQNLYFGLISSRSAVTTLDSRIKIRHGVKIQPGSEYKLIRLVTKKPHTMNLKNRLCVSRSVIMLTPKLSGHLIEKLASIPPNRGPMRAIAESLYSPKHFKDVASFQEDALQTALKTFGLTSKDQALSLELVEGHETALARVAIMEDSVIEHDARHTPMYDLVKSDLTGRAIFERGDERLEIITANRRPLERVFGVDLIYFNETRQNIVMIQYKMLEPFQKNSCDTDWIYKPDANLDREISRMRRFSSAHTPGMHEYRLNPAVFYLKFVKRDGLISNGGIIIPIDHFEKLRTDPTCRGPRNGLRVSYQSLSGCYLRQNAFLDLIRSGYIGAHAETTANLMILVESVLKNNRAVVAAIQQSKQTGADDDFDFDDESSLGR